MRACDLTIITITDGTESCIRRSAEMELSPLSALLCYNESGAIVEIQVKDGKVLLSRKGDYSLSLILDEGKTTRGTLGISGSNGEIFVSAERVGFSIGEKSFLANLKYTLDFGREKQKMQLRLNARESISEEK